LLLQWSSEGVTLGISSLTKWSADLHHLGDGARQLSVFDIPLGAVEEGWHSGAVAAVAAVEKKKRWTNEVADHERRILLCIARRQQAVYVTSPN